MKALRWRACLPIKVKRVKILPSDLEYFAQRGCSTEQLAASLAVLHTVRKHALPLLRKFAATVRDGLWTCKPWFLIHDRTSGVPTRAAGSYVDLSLRFDTDVDVRKFLTKWRFVRPEEPGAALHELLVEQTRWYLKLIETYENLSDVELLKQVRQHLHYFANMSQQRVA